MYSQSFVIVLKHIQKGGGGREKHKGRSNNVGLSKKNGPKKEKEGDRNKFFNLNYLVDNNIEK